MANQNNTYINATKKDDSCSIQKSSSNLRHSFLVSLTEVTFFIYISPCSSKNSRATSAGSICNSSTL
jgi:hypothetical protein